jgi:hypothetical protein
MSCFVYLHPILLFSFYIWELVPESVGSASTEISYGIQNTQAGWIETCRGPPSLCLKTGTLWFLLTSIVLGRGINLNKFELYKILWLQGGVYKSHVAKSLSYCHREEGRRWPWASNATEINSPSTCLASSFLLLADDAMAVKLITLLHLASKQ